MLFINAIKLKRFKWMVYRKISYFLQREKTLKTNSICQPSVETRIVMLKVFFLEFNKITTRFKKKKYARQALITYYFTHIFLFLSDNRCL